MAKVTFREHGLFMKAIREAFEKIVNLINIANLISIFCDKILKKGGDALSEDQRAKDLDSTMHLFGYLGDKDLFAEHYR